MGVAWVRKTGERDRGGRNDDICILLVIERPGSRVGRILLVLDYGCTLSNLAWASANADLSMDGNHSDHFLCSGLVV